ncbi:hypothetical protein DY023_00995 [Microbacterium bovistercoris]|uniref:DUF559 domain-containing protein n=1 Tax=Microbacterium bovistercoris TaxID=2293570 RepID=A0A371NXY0_9MICO|nr:hypothetical protein [Microbacterium bovistercoris]REJ08344.1 hypothetical protein DY023_00995 [Microbacterium bovistercoris]
MTARRPLSPSLDTRFTTAAAIDHGTGRHRLRAADLDAPFYGVRALVDRAVEADPEADPYALQAAQRRDRVRDLAPRLLPDQFVSHESAAAMHRAPLPLEFQNDQVADLAHAPVHVSAVGAGPIPRGEGVHGHRDRKGLADVVEIDGIAVTSPASTWASLGHLPLADLVAVGDHFCRVWREGRGRPDVGRAPIATVGDLRRAITAGRRVGIVRLREAVELVREDAWSPRESAVRVVLWQWGLPEPALNVDIFHVGRFLGCVDLAYPDLKIAIEYQSVLHTERYAKDVERFDALRAAGWIVIEVTAELLQHPKQLAYRVRRAIEARRPGRSLFRSRS